MLHSSASAGQQHLVKRTKQTLGDPTAHVGKLPKFNVESVAANDTVSRKRSLSKSILQNSTTTKFRTQFNRLTDLITLILCTQGNFHEIRVLLLRSHRLAQVRVYYQLLRLKSAQGVLGL